MTLLNIANRFSKLLNSENKIIVIYSDDEMPLEVTKSIFLAGPSPRDKDTKSWRIEALKLLKELGYDGHVFIPERKNGYDGKDFDYNDQVEWETKALNVADSIVFWVPRDLETLPGFTTNVEFGYWADSGKVILGYPKDADKMRYLQSIADEKKIPSFTNLKETLAKAIEILGNGSLRKDGEVQIPLMIWNHSTFQSWYKTHKSVGNRIENAKVLWSFRVGPKRNIVFCFSVLLHMWIESEKRIKTNEFLLARTDLSSLVLYYPSKDIMYTKILLVKEFRTPARTKSGFIYELPGGSSKNTNEETKNVAIHELEEETSFKIEPERLRLVNSLQVCGTFSGHTNTVFAAELSTDEAMFLEQLAKSDKTFGVEEDTEKTYVEFISLGMIIKHNLVDWANLGMIFSAIK